METKLCRLCGKIGPDFLQIFNADGLKNKIETCLPLIISPHSLLPDTICGECTENINNFHQFMKNCLQNTIILEAQYNIEESCLKSKQKKDKGCMIDLTFMTNNKLIQTDDFLDVISGNNHDLKAYGNILPSTVNYLENANSLSTLTSTPLVDYNIESDSQPDDDNEGVVILGEKLQTLNKINRLVDSVIFNTNKFSNNAESKLISEITQRKYLKRKNDCIEQSKPKICRWDSTNRRKNKIPKKLDITESVIEKSNLLQPSGDCNLTRINDKEQKNEVPYSITENASSLQVSHDIMNLMPHKCLLCDWFYNEPAALVAHIFEAHGFDMTGQSLLGSTEWIAEKNKRRIPNLVKISDLKKSNIIENNQLNEDQSSQEQLESRFICSDCPATFTDEADLLQHIQSTHPKLPTHICGVCSYQCSSLSTLQDHLMTCCEQLQSARKYICRICCFGDNNFRELEKHVLVHDFLIETCKKQIKIFDPADYIDCLDNVSTLSCTECGASDFESFKEFSSHRRGQHHIFHCDLCNKFYGRNSHLWKHVNRLHKGHPSITCQVCYKTSASKYHLVQHFNKMHLRNSKPKNIDVNLNEAEQTQQVFNVQSPKQALIKQEDKNTSENDDSSDYSDQEELMLQGCEIKQEIKEEPKEIDSSHDLYTNIITNYTPPQNEGEFKCPKCSKGFYKKLLLKKHRKNCRPKLQKDLLTRCKSCARVFKDRVSLTKHLVNYHSEYVCEICSQKVQSKCEIVAHIRFQHPDCNLICKICNNILRSKDDLREHLRNHVDSYICQFCADPLPSKIKLKMHILSLHRKILSLSCGICLKLFETQHVLKDHVGIAHKDQLTPLTSCPVCGKNYGSKWKTYDHLNKSHGRIFRACKTCLEVFDNDAQLQAHCDVTSHSLGVNGNGAVNFLKSSVLSLMGVTVKDEHNEDGSDIEEIDGSNESNGDSENEEEPSTTQPQFTLPQNTKISLLEKRLLGKALSRPDPNNKLNAPKSANPFEVKKEQLPAKREDESEQSNPLMNSSKRTVYVNSNDPSCCEICFKTWPAKKHLWQHYIRCHKAEAATVCGICLKMTGSYAVLQGHLQQNHPTLLHGQGFGSKFICRICGRYHNASSKLRLHMVIHENFDWKLIENISNINKTNETNKNPSTNGLKDCKQEPTSYDENGINYDSLIEQVECSSQSGDGDSDKELSKINGGNASSSDDNEDSNDSAESANRLRNAKLNGDGHQTSSSEDSSSSISDNEGSRTGTSVEESASESQSSQIKKNSNPTTIDSRASSLFERKPEELDSAIKSISYESVDQVELVEEDDVNMLPNCLNDNEIESAVDSIL